MSDLLCLLIVTVQKPLTSSISVASSSSSSAGNYFLTMLVRQGLKNT